MNVMITADDVVKIEIYDLKNQFYGVTKAFSFTAKKVLFKATGTYTVKVMSNSLPEMKKGDVMMLVFEYCNGNRYRTPVIADECNKSYFVAQVDEVEELEERRRFFKMTCNEKVMIYGERLTGGQSIPAIVLNINLGGVLLKSETMELHPGDRFYTVFFKGKLNIITKVLRVQKNLEGELIGYGCQFENISKEAEDEIARFIMQLQLEERERRKALEEDDF